MFQRTAVLRTYMDDASGQLILPKAEIKTPTNATTRTTSGEVEVKAVAKKVTVDLV